VASLIDNDLTAQIRCDGDHPVAPRPWLARSLTALIEPGKYSDLCASI